MPHFLATTTLLTSLALTASLLPCPVFALSAEEAALEAAMPSGDNLQKMKSTLARADTDMDQYFAYASLARQLRHFEEAAWALESMLSLNPNLPRVKLELGLTYIELGRHDDARILFQEVLDSDPPDTVKNNVGNVLAALDERTRTHRLNGAVILGVNLDTNANAAPGSGSVSVVDTTIPLGDGAGENTDAHGYLAVALNHSYDIDVGRAKPSWRWKTSAMRYGTEQSVLDTLNIRLHSLKTGPELVLPESQTKMSSSIGYTHIELDQQSYLRNPKVDFSIETILDPAWIGSYAWSLEYRDYLNSDTASTYRTRSGHAFQHVFGLKHVLSKQDIISSSLTMRREFARELYNANRQIAGNVTYTRAFWEVWFANAALGYKLTKYIIPDTFVSANDREDHEYSASIGIGRRFVSTDFGRMTISAGYQFRDVQSTIQNYEYENHRLYGSISKEFEY